MDAREAITANPHWYHTIELAPGVVTPGQVDLRPLAAEILPARLDGKRALDVGTFDGFWSFELERRGAEVVAIDVEALDAAQWPPLRRAEMKAQAEAWDMELGRGFELASELLGSKVRRVVCDVRELAPDAIGGPVDLVFLGALLVHLRDPVGALENVHDTLSPGGELILLETISTPLTALAPRTPVALFKAHETDFNWWQANLAAIRAWVVAAGFENTRRTGVHRPEAANPNMRDRYASFSARRSGANGSSRSP